MADSNRKVRFEFFQVTATRYNNDGKEEVSGLYNLEPLLTKINGIKEMTNRDRVYFDEKVRLDKIRIEKENPTLHFLHFTRLRNDVPAYAEINSDELKGIPLKENEYIAEDITTLYDPEISVLMVQRNVHSLSASGIEEYFNLMLDDKNFVISLSPVVNKKVISDALSKNEYRRIDIGIASLQKAKELGTLEKLTGPFKDIHKLVNNFSGNNISITISAGNGKENLDTQETKNALKIVKDNIAFFKSAVVVGRDEDGLPAEKFDLIKGKVYLFRDYKVPTGSFLNSETVIADIISTYLNENRKGYREKVIGYMQ